MDWTDLHCERQFKLVNKLFFHLLTLANVPEVSGRIRVSRCKKEKLAHPTRFEREALAFGKASANPPIAKHRVAGYCRRRNPFWP
jgi:hypothetical protein